MAPSIAPGKVAWVAFGVAVTAFVSWIILGVVDFGGDGEHWAVWSTSIDVIWMIIPAALFVGIVSAIIATSAPAQTGETSRLRGFVVLVLVVAFGVFLVLLLLNLHIS